MTLRYWYPDADGKVVPAVIEGERLQAVDMHIEPDGREVWILHLEIPK